MRAIKCATKVNKRTCNGRTYESSCVRSIASRTEAALKSYVEKSIDERIVTRVAHCQPVRA